MNKFRQEIYAVVEVHDEVGEDAAHTQDGPESIQGIARVYNYDTKWDNSQERQQ